MNYDKMEEQMRKRIMKLIDDLEWYKNQEVDSQFLIGFMEQQLKNIVLRDD